MTTQPTFFGYASTATRQGRLWSDGPRESPLTCQCGRALVRTPSVYLCCPGGCGKLLEAAHATPSDEDSGSGLDDAGQLPWGD